MIKHYISTASGLEELTERQEQSWIHITPPFNNDEIVKLSNELDVPLDFITDSLDMDERSRYEVEDSARLILINTPVINERDNENEALYVTVPVGIILTDDHIITVSTTDNPVIQLFLDQKVKSFDQSNSSKFVLQLFQQTVLRFLLCLKKLNLKRNMIEQELYDSSRNQELKQLLRIEKSLVYFVNSLSSNELLKMKIKRVDFLKIHKDEDLVDLFEDIIIDNSQALEMANVYTNILGGTMEAFASLVSNNLTRVMQRLTLITIVLMVPTLVASFYGMNVKLPFEDSEYSFVGLLLLSVAISLMVVWFFRRQKMF